MDSYYDANIALKRRQTSGLIPFPRVGRRNERTLTNRFLVEQIKRREGLIPFPRVGRSGKNNDEKLKDISMAWFGPQMGRDYQRLKSDLEDQYIISLLQDYQLAAIGNKEDKSNLEKKYTHADFILSEETKNKNAESLDSE